MSHSDVASGAFKIEERAEGTRHEISSDQEPERPRPEISSDPSLNRPRPEISTSWAPIPAC